VIDVHAHFFSTGVLDELTAHRRALAVSYDTDGRRLVFPSGPSRPLPSALADLGDRRTWNEERRISLQVLSPWLDVAGDDLAPRDAVAWVRLLNDAVAKDLDGADDFRAFAALPVSAGDAAAEELRRTVSELGYVGAAIPTQVAGTSLTEAKLEGLFEAAAALDAPLFLHPFRVLGEHRMGQNFMTNVCGNPFETTLAAMDLFFAGVFDRNPRLRVLLAHGGGALPFIAGRAAHAAKSVPSVTRRLDAPEELFNLYFYDTVVHDVRALRFAVDLIGPTRIALGSDVPFPMCIDDPAAHLRNATSHVDDGAFDAVAVETPARLLGRTHAELH
jgi:aminocarboxymuconate-semialdehyde decarboxylase